MRRKKPHTPAGHRRPEEAERSAWATRWVSLRYSSLLSSGHADLSLIGCCSSIVPHTPYDFRQKEWRMCHLLFLISSTGTGESQGDHTAAGQLLLFRQQPVHQPQGQHCISLWRWFRLELGVWAGGTAFPEEAPWGGQLNNGSSARSTKFSSEGRESYSNGLFLVVFCVPQSPQTSLINLFQWMSTLDSTPEETSARFTRERTLTENGLFYSPSLSDCSSILRPGTRNNKRWFKPKMRQLCNLRTCCFVFVFLYPCLQSLQVDIQRVEWGIQLLALLKYTFLLTILKPA